MRFGSVCSGIEAASVAWEPMGWRAAWLAEIEAFPSSVLAHRWPDVANHGNMLRLPGMVARGEIEAPEVLVGGTPCQAFSVAGKRGSLEDERGALTLAYVELLNEIDRRRQADGLDRAIAVWENVPGVLSTKDNAFGCFLAGLAGEDQPLFPAGPRWSNAGCVFGPARTVAWRVLDAQYFGAAQRRRRVFVVASARDGFDPCEVLFERDGLRRDTAPRREKGEGFTHDIAPSLTSRGRGVERAGETRGQDPVIAQWPAEVASTLNAAFGSKQGLEDQHVNGGCPLFVPAVSVALRGRDGGATAELGGEIATALRASTGGGDKPHVLAVHGTQDPCVGVDVAFAQGRNSGGENAVLVPEMAVRRLTPRECERLQGFPDDHTLVPVKTKRKLDADELRRLRAMTHEQLAELFNVDPDTFAGCTDEDLRRLAADGPRYKALGNSMAVPCMAFIGRRIHDQTVANIATEAAE